MERNDILEKIVVELEYTCRDIHIICIENGIQYESLDEGELEYIDENIFCCDFCGWWYPIEQKNNHVGDFICDDCKEDEEDNPDDEIEED